ncbi:cytochrome P450 [Aureobasidium sp. EXF-3400]|nr:cytochrome P450 [Aureobasidium sp. EXF-12344]KAI4783093.1 cytochrome P450 [Aureobasidium sp. EXF-3400]
MDSNATVTPIARLQIQPTASQKLDVTWVTAVVTFLFVAITTRFLSGFFGTSKPAQNGSRSVPMLPYWIPILGHIPQFSFSPQRLLDKARDTYRSGIFALNLGSTTHNIIFAPSMGGSLMNQKHSIANMDSVGKHILTAVFGYPTSKSSMQRYDQALTGLNTCYKHLLSDSSLKGMIQNTIDVTKRNIANLVTFSESRVDQVGWERTSNAETITKPNGEQVVEASMMHLVRDFVAANANPSLIGSDFVDNNPEFFLDLWDMDKGFKWLATGLSAWLPIPQIWKAKIARSRSLNAVLAFEKAMEKAANGEDPGQEWQYLENVGPVLTERLKLYRHLGFTMHERAALDLCLLWAMNANANMLVFWMLNHIYADKKILSSLREEIAPFVHAVQPTQLFNVPEPPRIDTFDHEALASKCPLLKSCYVESLRLDAATWSFRVMQEDLVLPASRDKDAEKFFLKKGTYAHIAHSIHHTDPAYFDDPHVWRADRHIKREQGDGEVSVNMGTIRPYGGGHSMCKGRAFAQKETLVFIAAFISMWDMEPVGGGAWKMPSYKPATGVYSTNDDVRVWISRREDLPQV